MTFHDRLKQSSKHDNVMQGEATSAIVISKFCIFMFCVLFLLSARAIAEKATEYDATTDKRILFSNIPWNITVSELDNSLEALGVEFRSTYSEYGNAGSSLSASSTSFGDGTVVPIVGSKHVPTRVYWIQPENTFTPLLKVAGHSVSWIYASFYNKYPTSLYELDIHVSSNKLISAEQQYGDLKDKLTVLYGEPHCYFNEDPSTDTYCSVWLGSDDTAVYLKRYHFKRRNSESVSLCYGLASSCDAFLRIEEQATIESEQRKNEVLDNIADDYSGL